MARRGQRQSGANRSNNGNQPRAKKGNQRAKQRVRELDNEGILPVLAKAVREVENRAQRGPVQPEGRTKFQVVALLVREERARLKVDETVTEAERTDQLKRLDGVATILAKTAARDTSLLQLLAEESEVSSAARALKREMLQAGGIEPPAEPVAAPSEPGGNGERRVVPQSVVSRQLANPFQAPDFTAIPPRFSGPRRLATWELIGPLLRSFEYAGGASACMELPEPPESPALHLPGSRELMGHQARVVAAAAAGHRTFLLADEPGLGKTEEHLVC